MRGQVEARLAGPVRGACALMLQREVPAEVNVAAARLAHAAGVPVFIYVGTTSIHYQSTKIVAHILSSVEYVAIF